MADITESAVWEDNIYELATTDPVKGGTPVIGGDGSVVSGHANVQAQKLANRTKYLKQRVDAWPEKVDAAGTAFGLITAHNNNPDAHPELVSLVSDEVVKAGAEADRAEDAADAAMASGKIYVDTSAGLAATVNGQYFSVPSADSLEYLILYKNQSGVASEVKRYPSAPAINALKGLVHKTSATDSDYTGTSSSVPIITDADGRVIISVDRNTGFATVAGFGDIASQIQNELALELMSSGYTEYIGTGPVYPVITDEAGRLILGVNSDNGTLVGAGIQPTGGTVTGTSAASVPLPSPAASSLYNHLIFYGQSLSIGAAAGSVISTTQPYSNVTFNGGPRAYSGTAWDFSGFKPLVEDAVTAPDGGTNRQETVCSGAANYASTLMALDGIDPASHIILASTAGHGGYRIDQLNKQSTWYQYLIDHAEGGHALNPNHSVPAVGWIQGESDADSVTSYASYKSALLQLQTDIENDIKFVTAQTGSVYLLTYQCSYRSTATSAIARAQLDVTKESEKIFMVSPTYHLPYAADRTHLTAVGYKILGSYFGRAYKQLAAGFKPQSIKPVSATVNGDTIRVRFDVPTSPLVLDTTNLAVTTNFGFAVTVGGSSASISTITVSGNDVLIKLASTPTSDVVVKYALNNTGAGLSILLGGSGNLRDSTPDTTKILGVEYPLWHVCPAFELNAITLGE